jgi:TPR repeat protein
LAAARAVGHARQGCGRAAHLRHPPCRHSQADGDDDQQAVGSLGDGEKLTIPIDDGRRLCAEGLAAFAKGDIATARAFFVSAASAGDARALVGLGDTFDPATLTRLGVIGLKGDEAKARDYYSRAVTAGASGARERIASLASSK